MTSIVRAFAAAKVNLDLRVLGRRDDGYHELNSLVAFADVGDRLVLERSDVFSLLVDGPFAEDIDGSNLIATAAERLQSQIPGLGPGCVNLHKVLPVGAGIGGGSADVAAYLRGLSKLEFDLEERPDWDNFVLTLGADVPVCHAGRVCRMRSIGEIVEPVPHALPALPAVLVNPGIALSTPDVFRALAAASLEERPNVASGDSVPRDWDALIAYLSASGNDLEAPALTVLPEISVVRRMLGETDGVRLVRMSGSGATFFGLYDTIETARTARDTIRNRHSDWWVEATLLGNAPDNNCVVSARG